MVVDRRKFLRRCIHSALGGVALCSAFGNLRVIGEAAAQSSTFPDYKALVCVFLYGGNDAFNTIVPRDAAGYGVYSESRGGLALPQAQLHAINPLVDGLPGDGSVYGLHPALPDLAGLFNTGRAAIVANVGTLIHPTTRAQYQNGSVALPSQLFAHSEQTTLWQSARADDIEALGWGGRMADLLHAGNPNPQLSMSMSLFGENEFQRGTAVPQYIMSPFGVVPQSYLTRENNAAGVTAFRALAEAAPQAHAFERAYADANNRAIDTYEAIGAALNASGEVATAFPSTELGIQLRMVARLIKARDVLNMRRQVFFVALPGLDTHNGQLVQHANMMDDLSRSLKAFYDATVELGISDKVTAYTASEFGRTVSINGDGTDHGWGGHHFVVGGAVRGQRFYGRMPSLARNDNPDDAGYGQIIPTLSVDQYSATLARWFGVDAGGIADIFPNLGRFGSSDLGFMTA